MRPCNYDGALDALRDDLPPGLSLHELGGFLSRRGFTAVLEDGVPDDMRDQVVLLANVRTLRQILNRFAWHLKLEWNLSNEHVLVILRRGS